MVADENTNFMVVSLRLTSLRNASGRPRLSMLFVTTQAAMQPTRSALPDDCPVDQPTEDENLESLVRVAP